MVGFSRSMRLATTIAIAVVLVLASAPSAYAVKAYPKPVTYYQPDGTPFEARMIGDERIVIVEDKDGLTLVQDYSTGWYHYADPASHGASRLRPTALRPGKETAPQSWRKHVRPAIQLDGVNMPPRDQQDDGSVRDLFRRSSGQKRSQRYAIGTNAVKLTPTTVPVLVILVEFSDWKHTTGAGTPVAGEPNYQPIAGQPNSAPTWQTVFNDPTVEGGLNHFYKEATYGRFQWNVTVAQRGKGQAGTGTLINDGWYTNPNTMKYWGADKNQFGGCSHDGGTAIKNLITWAVQQADADVNYAQYDTDGNGSISDAELMIFVVHAREGQENYGDGCGTAPADPNNDHIWSHKWNMATSVAVDGKTIPSGHIYAIEPEFSPVFNYATSPWTLTDKYFGVGVYAHEALHTLGAPDIYDTDGSSIPAGEWDLMDSGSYNGVKSGTHPAHMGGPLKQDIKLNADTDTNSYGFLLETEVTEIGADGAQNILATGNGITGTNVLHRIKAPNNTNEWFLIENRAAVGYYEKYLPEYGLVIWHRDRSASGSNNSTWPYQANVLRKGWANTTTGLNASVLSAAFSSDDGETSFTATTDPNNKLNSGSASGLKDVRCISAESSAMSYAYGTVAGSHVSFGGASVSGGDGDVWIDYGESATLNVRVTNSSCAGATASNITAVVTSASGVVSASLPSSIASLAPGATGELAFGVDLGCATCGDVNFDYTIYAGGVAIQTGSFSKPANRSYLWFDDADTQAKAGWSSSTTFVPSACTSAVRHGDWSVVSHPFAPRGNSYRAPVDSTGLTFANPDEVWISPNITIPADATLKNFNFSYAAEIPCVNYTRGRLWVSTDNGATWKRHDEFYRDGGNLSWEEVSTNISAYQGATQIRFLFGVYTYECQSGCTGTRGVYVDNIGVVVAQQGGSTPSDTTAPVTAITSPAEGAIVSGTVTVSASATDDTGVSRVDFLVNGTLAASDSASPYSFSWNTTAVANGTYSLTSKAYDAAGNNSTSAAVSVTVSNTVTADTTAPATSITSPAAGATVSGTTSVTASATDNVGVTTVEFYVDGILTATDTSSPYSFSWNTTTALNGSHTLSSKAYDAAGNAGTSATVTVTVSNSTADVTGPVISNVSSRKTANNGSFDVLWTTNEASDSAVSFDNQATWHVNTSMVTSHVMGFRGSKGVKYTYYVRSKDAAGNTSISGPFSHQN